MKPNLRIGGQSPPKPKRPFPLCELLSPRGGLVFARTRTRDLARVVKGRSRMFVCLFGLAPHKMAITTGDKFGTDFRPSTFHDQVSSLFAAAVMFGSANIRRRTQPRQNNQKNERRTVLFTTETSATRCAHVSLLD
jgi:hypothetical protein